jgi:hypothetical protein
MLARSTLPRVCPAISATSNSFLCPPSILITVPAPFRNHLRSHRTGLIGEARRSPQMTFRSAATAAETWLFVTLSGALPIPEQSGRLGLRQAVRFGLRGERATPAKRYAQALRRELPGRAGGSGLARAPAAGGSGSRRRLHFAPRFHWLWRDDTDVIFPL